MANTTSEIITQELMEVLGRHPLAWKPEDFGVDNPNSTPNYVHVIGEEGVAEVDAALEKFKGKYSRTSCPFPCADQKQNWDSTATQSGRITFLCPHFRRSWSKPAKMSTNAAGLLSFEASTQLVTVRKIVSLFSSGWAITSGTSEASRIGRGPWSVRITCTVSLL